jgi:hypothetical protein
MSWKSGQTDLHQSGATTKSTLIDRQASVANRIYMFYIGLEPHIHPSIRQIHPQLHEVEQSDINLSFRVFGDDEAIEGFHSFRLKDEIILKVD